MKSTLCLLLSAGVIGLAPKLCGLPPELGGPAEEQVRIFQRVRPAFPERLSRRGIQSGEVRLLMLVDADGMLGDYLVTAYTHPELADMIPLLVPHWRFAAATYAGESYETTIDVAARFTPRGLQCEVRDPAEAPSWHDRGYAFSVAEEHQLDVPLKPTRTPAPRNPALAGEDPLEGTARVDYFVDESGRVRLPRVVAADDDRLGWAALAEIRQTWYQQPKRHKKRTLVHVTRTIRFGPGQ